MKLIQFDIELDVNTEKTTVKPIAEFVINEILLNSPEKIFCVIRDTFDTMHLADEFVFEIAFNYIFKPIGIFLIARGDVSSVCISVRGIFMRALLLGASSIILLYNHPSGSVEASSADLTSAHKLYDAGKLLGITVADFIILGRDTYYSFSEHNILNN